MGRSGSEVVLKGRGTGTEACVGMGRGRGVAANGARCVCTEVACMAAASLCQPFPCSAPFRVTPPPLPDYSLHALIPRAVSEAIFVPWPGPVWQPPTIALATDVGVAELTLNHPDPLFAVDLASRTTPVQGGAAGLAAVRSVDRRTAELVVRTGDGRLVVLSEAGCPPGRFSESGMRPCQPCPAGTLSPAYGLSVTALPTCSTECVADAAKGDG